MTRSAASVTALTKDRLLSVLDALPSMVAYWNSDWRCEYINAASLPLYGWEPDRVQGLHLREFLGADRYTSTLPILAAVEQGRTVEFDREMPSADGRVRHLRVTYVPDLSAAGEFEGMFALVNDVSDFVQLVRERNVLADRYRTLARNLPTGFAVLFDHDLRFQVADGRALAAFGFTPEDLEGKLLSDVLADQAAFPDDESRQLVATVIPHYRAALAGQTSEWDATRGDRVFHLTAGPVFDDDGKVAGGIVIGSDVTERRRDQGIWEALHDVTNAVARQASEQHIVEMVARQLNAILNVDGTVVAQFDGDDARVLALTPAGPDGIPPVFSCQALDECPIARVGCTGQNSLIRYEPGAEPVLLGVRTSGLRASAAAPIWLSGTVWGAIGIAASQADRISEETVARLTSFAELISVALGNISAWNALAASANTDPLTQLPNRRGFDEHFNVTTARVARGSVAALAVVDIDHFKQVNDTYGHDVGDDVLRAVAATLRACVRGSEVVGRFGGEEFTWLLPDTGLPEALLAAERARATLAATTFPHVGRLTVSIGVASTEATSPAELFKAADQALYRAKQNGRNQVQAHPHADAAASATNE